MKFKTIFIANFSEYVLPLANLMKKESREEEIYLDNGLCDRFLLDTGDDRILITPKLIDKDYWEDTTKRLEYKNWVNYSPNMVMDSICEAIWQDKELEAKIEEVIRNNPGIEVLAYAATDEFVKLTESWRGKRLVFQSEEIPVKGREWTTSYLGSKAGFRQEVAKIRMALMPEGAVCNNREEVKGWANYIMEKYDGVVIKTNRGLSGAGLKIIRKSDLGERSLEIIIEELLESEPYWKKEPVVVEALINCDLTIAGGNPNSEVKVTEDGVELLYFCGMRIDPKGEFIGVEIGRDTAPVGVQNQVTEWGKTWGEYLRLMGYRGYFDMDCIIGKDGKIYPLESNTRRTGGTQVYKIGLRLLGESFWEEHYLAADNMLSVPKLAGKDFRGIKRVAEDLFYPVNSAKEGILITGCSLLEVGKIGYMVIGPNRKRAEEIEKEFLKRVK
jgi:hypothetical protein